MIEPVILVHGGAWSVPDNLVDKTIDAVKAAALIGYKVLQDGGSPLDVVEAAVRHMEDNEDLNAGIGSSLNVNGEVYMDSSIQRGSDLKAGCVTLLNDVRHPVSLARLVLEKTPHVFIGGDGARQLAIKEGLEICDPETFITDFAKLELQDLNKNRNDTVGAVVVDRNGNVAAATSTGGTAGKYVGRIGDAPVIGCGTYADDLIGAVSSTGHGESILKFCLAHTILKHMEGGLSCQRAVTKSVIDMTERVKNKGGAIAVSKSGDVGFHFTTDRMSWCYIKSGELHYGIEPAEHNIEKIEIV